MSSNSLHGSTILITGATFGIGEALTRHLMRFDVRLILVARTTEKLLLLKNESVNLPAEITTFTCDFYDEKDVEALCDKLKSFSINYFVSNAGKSLMRSLGESKQQDYKKTIVVNYLAPVQLITSLKEKFGESKTHIINVSTYNVLMKVPPKWSAYVSSKIAMHVWFESNRAELNLMSVTISHIYLPLVESRMKDANTTYENVRAMPMDKAIAAIMKGIVNRSDFKPWWHVPFQVLMFFGSPFWNGFWLRLVRRNKY
jgi:short-subunit dehydrogenase